MAPNAAAVVAAANMLGATLPSTAKAIERDRLNFTSQTKMPKGPGGRLIHAALAKHIQKGVPLEKALFGLTQSEKATATAILGEYHGWLTKLAPVQPVRDDEMLKAEAEKAIAESGEAP